jgi:WD40 repeat protein
MPAFDSLKLIKELSRQEMFFALANPAGSSRLFVGASDGNVYDVDPLSGDQPEFKPLGGHTSYVTGVAIAAGAVISGSYDGKLIWRSLENGQIVRELPGHTRWIRKVIASPDGQFVASVADDMVCKLWNAHSGELLRVLSGHDERTPTHFPSMLYACAFSPDGLRIATADRVGRICLWNVSDGAALGRFDAAEMYTWDPKQRIHSIGGIRSVAFSPDGKRLAVGGVGQINNIDGLDGLARVEVFNLDTNDRYHAFAGDSKGLVNQLIFSPDGQRLLGLGGAGAGWMQVYDLAEKKIVKTDKAPMHVHAATFSSDGKTLFGCGHGRVAVWQADDGTA